MTLFIGGPYDGRHIETELETVYVQEVNPPSKNPCSEILQHRYFRTRLTGTEDIHVVYAISGFNGDDIISSLIKGYKSA